MDDDKTTDEALAAAIGLDDEDAEGWRPEPGDLLIGEVVKIARGWSDFKGEYYPILTIQGADGSKTAVHCFQYVLEDRILTLKPRVGEIIAIRYKGKEDSKDGRRQIAVYNVRIKGRDQEDPYSDMVGPRRSSVREKVREEAREVARDTDDDGDIPF